jgi:hypothetical protein
MISKDTKKNIQSNIFDIPDSIIPEDKRLFLPTWDNKPPQQQTIVKTQGKRVLTTGNLLAIVSRPGAGKSSICEVVIANILNPKCDSLGFEVNLQAPRDKVLYIDTERTPQDTWNSWERTYRRAGLKKPYIDNHVIFANFKAISINDRKKYVEKIFENNQDIGLIIFDGAGDFIRDTNSLQESGEFIDWINTFNFSISIIVSLHTNPNDNKPRGHIGSELCRRAESVLLLRKLEDGVRQITTDFEHGKVRNDDDTISSFYKYSDDLKMFISSEYVKEKHINNEKKEEYRTIANEIFEGKTICSPTFIITKIAEKIGKKEVAAKGIFYRHFQNKLVVFSEDGYKLK